MDLTSGKALYCRTLLRTSSRRAGAIALLLLGLTTHAGSVRANDSDSRLLSDEILTPPGWERTTRCTKSEPTSRELMVPDGWGDARSAAAWGEWMCSELVVPADWTYSQHG